jgi:hypothetical protein
MRTVAILGVGVLLALCVARHDELLTAVASVPPATLIGLAALHLLGLAARSEAWRMSLGAIGGAALCCGLARIWLALSVVHLDASPSEVAVAFAMLGAFGLLRSARRPRPARCWCSPAAPGRWPPASC